MPSSTFQFVHQFVEDLGKKKHDFSSDTFKFALTNTTPTLASAVLADITEIAYTFCSTRTIAGVTCEQVSGTAPFTFTDHTLTASGGSVGPFQWIVVYNDTAAGDLIVGYLDYGAPKTLANTEFITIDGGANGFGTITHS